MKKIVLIFAAFACLFALSLNLISNGSNLLVRDVMKSVEKANSEYWPKWELNITCYPDCGDYDKCSYYGWGNECWPVGETTCNCGDNCC